MKMTKKTINSKNPVRQLKLNKDVLQLVRDSLTAEDFPSPHVYPTEGLSLYYRTTFLVLSAACKQNITHSLRELAGLLMYYLCKKKRASIRSSDFDDRALIQSLCDANKPMTHLLNIGCNEADLSVEEFAIAVDLSESAKSGAVLVLADSAVGDGDSSVFEQPRLVDWKHIHHVLSLDEPDRKKYITACEQNDPREIDRLEKEEYARASVPLLPEFIDAVTIPGVRSEVMISSSAIVAKISFLPRTYGEAVSHAFQTPLAPLLLAYMWTHSGLKAAPYPAEARVIECLTASDDESLNSQRVITAGPKLSQHSHVSVWDVSSMLAERGPTLANAISHYITMLRQEKWQDPERHALCFISAATKVYLPTVFCDDNEDDNEDGSRLWARTIGKVIDGKLHRSHALEFDSTALTLSAPSSSPSTSYLVLFSWESDFNKRCMCAVEYYLKMVANKSSFVAPFKIDPVMIPIGDK